MERWSPSEGKFGSPEFKASYDAACSGRIASPHYGTLQGITTAYQESADFAKLKPRTRSDYLKQLVKIETKFGGLPLVALKAKAMRQTIRQWRDEMAKTSERQADYCVDVFALILNWAKEGGLVDVNPAAKMGNLYDGSRRDAIWSDDDEARFMAAAPPHLGLAMRLALWTGQRQGDLLALTWNRYDGQAIRLEQGKTKQRLVIPVGAPLKATLDATRRVAPHILTTLNETPWTSSGFRASWRKARILAGVHGLTFHDLRGSAVTRLAVAGCTVPEIASITGHTLAEVRGILDRHYLAADPELAKSAIRKLEKRTKLPTELPNGRDASSQIGPKPLK